MANAAVNGLGGSKEKTRQSWATPVIDFNDISDLYGPFDLDAAADIRTTKCARYISEKNDAFVTPWIADQVWCNPPHREPMKWIRRAEHEVLEARNCDRVVLLLPASVETEWFRYIASRSSEVLLGDIRFLGTMGWSLAHPWRIRFWHRRIQFVPPPGVKASNNPKASALLILDGKDGDLP